MACSTCFLLAATYLSTINQELSIFLCRLSLFYLSSRALVQLLEPVSGWFASLQCLHEGQGPGASATAILLMSSSCFPRGTCSCLFLRFESSLIRNIISRELHIHNWTVLNVPLLDGQAISGKFCKKLNVLGFENRSVTSPLLIQLEYLPCSGHLRHSHFSEKL